MENMPPSVLEICRSRDFAQTQTTFNFLVYNLLLPHMTSNSLIIAIVIMVALVNSHGGHGDHGDNGGTVGHVGHGGRGKHGGHDG